MKVIALFFGAFGALLATAAASASVLPQATIDAAMATATSVHRVTPGTAGVTFPEYSIDGTDFKGFVDPDSLGYGYLANGTDVLMVPLGTRGSGGVFYTLLFTHVKTQPYYVGYVPGKDGHLSVFISSGALFVKTPIYKGTDANCCPSGMKTQRYTIADGKLKELAEGDQSAATGSSALPKATIDAALATAKDIHPAKPDGASSFPKYASDDGKIRGAVIANDIDYGYLSNGADVLVVPLDSGGSGGVFYALLFTTVQNKPYYVGYIPSSGHLSIDIDAGRLIVETPVYNDNDAQCCPSMIHEASYSLVDRKLKKLGDRDVKTSML